MKYYLSFDHIRSGTWAVELTVTRHENKKTVKRINRPELECLEPAIFVSAKPCSSRDLESADSHVCSGGSSTQPALPTFVFLN